MFWCFVHESSAKEINPISDYKDNSQKKITCCTRTTFWKDHPRLCSMNGKGKLLVETFFPIIVTLNTHLYQRSESYNEIDERFSFIFQLQTIEPDHLKKMQRIYKFLSLRHEWMKRMISLRMFHLKKYLKTLTNESVDLNILVENLHYLIKADKLEEIFPNVEVVTRVFLCLMVTNSLQSGALFSQLKRI